METAVVFHVSTETDRERVDRNSVGRQESEILAERDVGAYGGRIR